MDARGDPGIARGTPSRVIEHDQSIALDRLPDTWLVRKYIPTEFCRSEYHRYLHPGQSVLTCSVSPGGLRIQQFGSEQASPALCLAASERDGER